MAKQRSLLATAAALFALAVASFALAQADLRATLFVEADQALAAASAEAVHVLPRSSTPGANGTGSGA